MARRSLRPELNRIRAWVQQGRTDAWIAHQLEVTVQQIQAFKRDQKLEASDEADGNGTARDFDDDIDLRAEDDALIAAESIQAKSLRRHEYTAVAGEAYLGLAKHDISEDDNVERKQFNPREVQKKGVADIKASILEDGIIYTEPKIKFGVWLEEVLNPGDLEKDFTTMEALKEIKMVEDSKLMLIAGQHRTDAVKEALEEIVGGFRSLLQGLDLVPNGQS